MPPPVASIVPSLVIRPAPLLPMVPELPCTITPEAMVSVLPLETASPPLPVTFASVSVPVPLRDWLP